MLYIEEKTTYGFSTLSEEDAKAGFMECVVLLVVLGIPVLCWIL
jgi:hypothetical protein